MVVFIPWSIDAFLLEYVFTAKMHLRPPEVAGTIGFQKYGVYHVGDLNE